MPSRSIRTPIGQISLTEQDGTITALSWRKAPKDAPGGDDSPLLIEAERQLDAYFAGRLQAFDLPLSPSGDELQLAVAEAMRAIPFGRTREYGEIARAVGAMPKDVGAACGRNTIAILIPCHRVVGATGLGGFSAPGGVETKIALLRHEGAYSLLL
jgi:methylated-DNA-[protein]-cysteine S-methyltransferase